MLLSSSLKAGLSLLQSFEALVEEMPVPIASEFSLVIRQIQMGVPLEDAMYSLRKRMHVDELDLVVTAIMVARETGGNLTEIFYQVANTIQERNKLIGRVNALCVQGKLQGAIMSLLPILFGLFVFKTNPKFFDMFLQDNLGRFLLGYAFISEILGVFFIRKFSKIDI
jgi:tight adherence protein B